MIDKDCFLNGDADPFLPNENWNVEEHKKSGEMRLTCEGNDLYLDGKKIDFYLSEGQQNGKYIVGNKLRKELADKPVLNANVLDYLLKNPHLIPEAWKTCPSNTTCCIYFWGTVYRYSNGNLRVRCLYFFGSNWHWGDRWLDDVFRNHDFAVVQAS